MISLKEFNDEMRKIYSLNANKDFPRKNGIECPRCNFELNDIESKVMMMSNPPMIMVFCEKCHFKSWRYA